MAVPQQVSPTAGNPLRSREKVRQFIRLESKRQKVRAETGVLALPLASLF